MTIRNRFGTTLLALSLGATLWPTTAAAQTPPPGRLLAAQCSMCHGTNGQGPGFGDIAGENKYSDLREMAQRRVEGIMDRQARGYTDEQLRLLTDYLASQPQSNGGGSD